MKIKHQLLIFVGLVGSLLSLAQPAKADLSSAKETVDQGMTMLTGIADTGVAIVIVPFSISFALMIAGSILRHA